MTPLQDALFTYAMEHVCPTRSREDQAAERQAHREFEQAWDDLKAACPQSIKLMLAVERTQNNMTNFEVEEAFLAGLSVGLELGACI